LPTASRYFATSSANSLLKSAITVFSCASARSRYASCAGVGTSHDDDMANIGYWIFDSTSTSAVMPFVFGGSQSRFSISSRRFFNSPPDFTSGSGVLSAASSGFFSFAETASMSARVF
jgi:hypothetical protein